MIWHKKEFDDLTHISSLIRCEIWSEDDFAVKIKLNIKKNDKFDVKFQRNGYYLFWSSIFDDSSLPDVLPVMITDEESVSTSIREFGSDNLF